MEKRPIKKQRGHVPDKVWLYHSIPHLHIFLIENPDLREPSDLGNLEGGIKVRLQLNSVSESSPKEASLSQILSKFES